jgi:hypothetical protein
MLIYSFLQSEPEYNLSLTTGPFNEALQSLVVDVLQALIGRGEIPSFTLQVVESVVVGKLYSCIQSARLDLQNKLLHLLHSLVSASSFITHADARRTHGERVSDVSHTSAQPYSPNPLLTQTLTNGISIPSNRPILQHWLDFILMTIPQFHDMLQATIIPLNDCVCRQLKSALVEITQTLGAASTSNDIPTYTTDADFIMLLNALERLVLLSLSHLPDTSEIEDELLPEKSGHDAGGLLGYVSNVFGADSAPVTTTEQPSVSSLCESL